jgi:alpha-ribazole phosphatase
MKLWLIRHGLTRLGEEKRYQGVLDAGLSERGRAALKRADFAPRRVYVSPMRRARETAKILFPGAEQIPVPDLREMDFGVFEGRGWWEMAHDPAYRAWVDGGCAGRCPGGEDRAAYSARVCAAVASLLQTERDGLVIVAHGGTQMAALERWGEPAREYWQWQRPCGCGWLLDWDGERLRVLGEVDFQK